MSEVHFNEAVAHWVVEHQGAPSSELARKNAALFPDQAVNSSLFLSHESARELQNGVLMARLLHNLFEANGAACPVEPGTLAPGDAPAAILAKWKRLLPVLSRTFAVTLSADKLALLVGGDGAVLQHLVETLYQCVTS